MNSVASKINKVLDRSVGVVANRMKIVTIPLPRRISWGDFMEDVQPFKAET